MAEIQQGKVVSSDGNNNSSTTSTSQLHEDPITGTTIRNSSTLVRTGKGMGVDIIWLLAGIVLAFLALDFIFQAAGANNVGFASFIYSVGSFFAAPFTGIFNTTNSYHGNIFIWADILGMFIYLIIAFVLAKVASIVS